MLEMKILKNYVQSQKKFSIKDFFQETADFFTFTKEIIAEKSYPFFLIYSYIPPSEHYF